MNAGITAKIKLLGQDAHGTKALLCCTLCRHKWTEFANENAFFECPKCRYRVSKKRVEEQEYEFSV